MKTLFAILSLSLVSSWNVFGRAVFYTRSELIEKATAIAIVVLDEPKAAKATDSEQQDPFAEPHDRATGKLL